MRTVDLLIAVRKLFANPKNWTIGSLANPRGSKLCFCALGGILKEGGAMKVRKKYSAATGSMADDYIMAPWALASSTEGLFGILLEGRPYYNDDQYGSHTIDGLSRSKLATFESQGFYPVAITKAQRYLKAAIQQLSSGNYMSIFTGNDEGGYKFITAALDLAIKNSKRRHINGDRQKPAQKSAAA